MYHFVDEAGDPTIFNARGAVLVGSPGVSHTFMVGVAHLPDPVGARVILDDLRQGLLADPYFKGVPSMRPEAGRTALCFHAKDDLPEVRREVFRVLASLNASVRVAFRRKASLVPAARTDRSVDARRVAARLYDELVERVFVGSIESAGTHEICFARRGKSDRQEALSEALSRALGHGPAGRWTMRSSVPSADAGLQVVDYFLWAVQRLIERDEDRYFGLIASQVRLVWDLDDCRSDPGGRRYGPGDMLTVEKKKPLTS
ncbi:MAG: hypothetical protein LW650_09905 [Planctomycetaceae bacterium]|nr:hypothetical protein [Phycisphaerales bacterium]MCE2653777.1 hypothetical protein [Planctomycetaceae bacterium]